MASDQKDTAGCASFVWPRIARHKRSPRFFSRHSPLVTSHCIGICAFGATREEQILRSFTRASGVLGSALSFAWPRTARHNRPPSRSSPCQSRLKLSSRVRTTRRKAQESEGAESKSRSPLATCSLATAARLCLRAGVTHNSSKPFGTIGARQMNTSVKGRFVLANPY